jgi:sulfate transport system permease protein
VLAWALVRWEFPGRRFLDTLIDLPVAMPTLVIGLLLVAATGPLSLAGAWLGAFGVKVAYAPAGIVAALVFVSLPLVVRAVEPALAELDPAEEEAARTMGASEWTVLRRVLLPPIVPAIAAGAVQAFARAMAEFGSVAAVSGNVPGRTLTVPVWILGEVESGRADRAAAISVLLLGLALALHAVGRALAARVVGRLHG